MTTVTTGPRLADVDVTALQAHCVGKPGAWTDFPWEHEAQ